MKFSSSTKFSRPSPALASALFLAVLAASLALGQAGGEVAVSCVNIHNELH